MSSIRVDIIEINSGQLATYTPRTGQDEVWLKVKDLPNQPLFRWSGSMWVPVTGSVILGMSAVAAVTPADATEDTLATINVPAGLLGPNGEIEVTLGVSATNNANVKTMRVRYSGAAGTIVHSSVVTSFAGVNSGCLIANRGLANSQMASGLGFGFANPGAANTASAIDTTLATSVVITAQKANAGDALTLESYLVKAYPG